MVPGCARRDDLAGWLAARAERTLVVDGVHEDELVVLGPQRLATLDSGQLHAWRTSTADGMCEEELADGDQIHALGGRQDRRTTRGAARFPGIPHCRTSQSHIHGYGNSDRPTMLTNGRRNTHN